MSERKSKLDRPQKEPAAPEGSSPRVDLTGLIQLARTAYEQKRRKECLALTSAIMKIEPASNEARVLQSLIESDISQALQRINALVSNPRMKNDEELRSNAFQLLQSVLEIDPSNKAANALLPLIDPNAKREPTSGPPDPKIRIEHEKRPNRPDWTPPEVGPPETSPTGTDHPRTSWVRYAVLAAILITVAALAFHFGFFSNVLEWFGVASKGSTPQRTGWLVPAIKFHLA